MKKIFGTLFILSVLFAGTFALAGSDTVVSGGGSDTVATKVSVKLQNPIKVDTFSALVEKVIYAAVQILMPFVVLAFVYSGFLFVKAQGKQEEITAAKSAIGWSIVGAFILLGAWGFAQIIGKTVSTITS